MAEIAIRNVRKSFGKDEVIHGVDLGIRNGEFVVILGPSGCGKSTLLRMIAGLETVTSGEIAIGGTVVNELEPRERGCAMVFQNYALYPHMSVAENIGYALKVAGVKKAERMEKVRAVARTIGLEEYLDRKPAQLSGGQRQRVAMGRAMIREPKVFLFDEPLSNLDAKLRVQMRIEIRRLHQRLSATSIFVTHDQVEAMTLADRIIVMRAGHVEQVGTPSEIYDAPATHFVGEFIGSPPMSFLPGRVEAPGMLSCGEGHLAFDPARFDAAPGTAVNVGLRAEHMEVTPGRGRGIPAVFEFFEELGSARLLHARAGDAALVAETGRALALDPGAPVSVSVPAEHVHLYDPASGRRLAPARAMAEAAE